MIKLKIIRELTEKKNEKKRRQTEFNYNVIWNIRIRSHQPFRAQNMGKVNKTFDLIACSYFF